MIPKIIHYCWFGRGKMPKLARKCIKSWKHYCPDYEIKEWNEDNFNLDLIPYAREAYDNHKFAFVADVVRFYALYTEGGIYFDTDVELLRSIDHLLTNSAFTGFESEKDVAMGIVGSERGGRWTKENLDVYKTRHFAKPDGSLDMTTIVKFNTDYLLSQGLRQDNSLQMIPGLITVYPRTFFYPLYWKGNQTFFSEDTVAIHHYAGSWMPKDTVMRHKHPRLFKWWYWLVYIPQYEWRTKILKKEQ